VRKKSLFRCLKRFYKALHRKPLSPHPYSDSESIIGFIDTSPQELFTNEGKDVRDSITIIDDPHAFKRSSVLLTTHPHTTGSFSKYLRSLKARFSTHGASITASSVQTSKSLEKKSFSPASDSESADSIILGTISAESSSEDFMSLDAELASIVDAYVLEENPAILVRFTSPGPYPDMDELDWLD